MQKTPYLPACAVCANGVAQAATLYIKPGSLRDTKPYTAISVIPRGNTGSPFTKALQETGLFREIPLSLPEDLRTVDL